MSNAVLERAREKHEALLAKNEEILAKAQKEERDLTPAEVEETTKRGAKADEVWEQIKELRKQEKRIERAARAKADEPAVESRGTLAPGEMVVRSEPGVYRQDAIYRSEPSYLRDLAAVQIPQYTGEDREEARRRLNQNWVEVQRHAASPSSEHRGLARRIVDEEERFQSATGRRSLATIEGNSAPEFRVNPNTTAGTGGEFVPPLWLVNQYVPYDRPARVCANRVRNLPLPPGIDIINLPKITNTNNTQLTTTTQTAVQTGQGLPVNSIDLTTSTVSASVRTIAGQQDISLQLLEQSPIAMDGVVFDEISRDYDMQLDFQVVAGAGANGQHKGVFSLTTETKALYSTNDVTKAGAITVSSATFDGSTQGGQLRSILLGITNIESLAYVPPTAIWAHPRRANSWLFAADGNKRPLVNPNPYGPFSAVGVGQPTVAQGVAFELLGFPVIKDSTIPTTFNGTALTGGTADGVAVLKEDDINLWEGTLRMRALPEVLSGTLAIRFQCYAYSAFMPDRRPVGVALLTGNTGFSSTSLF